MSADKKYRDSPFNPFLEDLFVNLNRTLAVLQDAIKQLPGSKIISRYIRSSYQNDPFRYSFDKNHIQLSDNEIDELVDEWVPEGLVPTLPSPEQTELEKLPVIVGSSGPKVKLTNGRAMIHLCSYNFLNFAANDDLKELAIHTLRTYGVGACGPPGFYGTLDVHMKLESDIANFLKVSSAIIYAQAFSTISSVIPAFAKRGDVIVVDRGVNIAIQKGIQISRSHIRWYKHNDMVSLESALNDLKRERAESGKPLTRCFIVTEGLFENSGDIVDLPTLVALKERFRYRLILDESMSFGTLGRCGRGCTEHFGIDPTRIDMIVGSMTTSLCAAGGFCAGSEEIVEHQRISGTGFVYSAALPAILTTTASHSISLLSSFQAPEYIAQLRENTLTGRTIIDKSDVLISHSDPISPILQLELRPEHLSRLGNPNYKAQTLLLDEIIDECANQGILICLARRIQEQEIPDISVAHLKVCFSAAHSKKDTDKAANVIKSAASRIANRRRPAPLSPSLSQ